MKHLDINSGDDYAQILMDTIIEGEKSGMCNGSIYRWLVLLSNVFLTGMLER